MPCKWQYPRVIFDRVSRLKRLADFKSNERIPRPVIKALSMQFSDDATTRRIALHHAKCVIGQYKEEIQKLANK